MKSIQQKLATSLALGLTLLWLLATLGSGYIISHELGEAADSSLQVIARQLFSIAPSEVEHREGFVLDGSKYKADPKQAFGGKIYGDSLPSEVEDLFGYVIKNSHNDILAHGGNIPESLLQLPVLPGLSNTDGYRLYGEVFEPSQRSIVVVERLEHRDEANYGSIIILTYALLFLLPLSLLLVLWVVRRSLRDVQDVQQQIESRGGNDLRSLDTSDMPRELVPMVEAVNRLLQRLNRTLESERNFTTNSAHELRTPIASALAQTQRQIASLPIGHEQKRAKRIESTLQELARTSEKLMQLARAESGSMVRDSEENVYPIIEYLVDEYHALFRDKNRLEFHCLNKKQFETKLDPDGFAILLRNLLDNALKHGEPGAKVDLIVDSVQNEVRVINDGIVIPGHELVVLKERFKSSSKTRQTQGLNEGKHSGSMSSGAGLGLAIAETIASQAGVTLMLLSPARGRAGGFEACLSTQ